ncbi:MAG TPA: glycoside hydrolase family 3 protein, partial [Acidimicrobiia bacterium]|nr:glycoside hydrolase family 3 protein [Acidimicrobiia bacterium]
MKLRVLLVIAAVTAAGCSSASHGTDARATGSTGTSAPVLSPVSAAASTSSSGAASSTTSSSLSVTTYGTPAG